MFVSDITLIKLVLQSTFVGPVPNTAGGAPDDVVVGLSSAPFVAEELEVEERHGPPERNVFDVSPHADHGGHRSAGQERRGWGWGRRRPRWHKLAREPNGKKNEKEDNKSLSLCNQWHTKLGFGGAPLIW